MSFVSEFKDFIQRGNVIDLAVGVVIGTAFGKIVTSFVNDIIMPPIGWLTNGISFEDIKILLKEATVDATGKEIPAVTINIGNFINIAIEFIIIAFAIFLLVKFVNRLRKTKEEAAPPGPTKEEQLLTEIRDLLKK